MRNLNSKEQAFVSGGMDMPPGGGLGGGGGGSGTGGGSGDGPTFVFDERPDVKALAERTGLYALITAGGFKVVEGQTPHGAPGSSGAVFPNTEYIPSNLVNNDSTAQLLEQIAHETGHLEHPWDDHPEDFDVEMNYVHDGLVGEGWAQEQAIQQKEVLSSFGININIPGGNVAEVFEYVNDVADGDTASEIAHDLASFCADDTLKNGQTERQVYQHQWERWWEPNSY